MNATLAVVLLATRLSYGMGSSSALSVNVEISDEDGEIYSVFNVHNAKGRGISLFDAVSEEIISVLTNAEERERIIRDYSKKLNQNGVIVE